MLTVRSFDFLPFAWSIMYPASTNSLRQQKAAHTGPLARPQKHKHENKNTSQSLGEAKHN